MTIQHSNRTWGTAFPVFILDRGELQAYLSRGEVDQLTDENLVAIAALLKQELEELGFYEQMIHIVRGKLAEKIVL